MSISAPNPPKETTARRTLSQRAVDLMYPTMGTLTSLSARQGGLSLIDQGIVSVASFLTSVIVARATSREELGVYYLALTLVLLGRGVQMQVVSAPYMIYCHRKHGDDQAAYTGSSLVHQLALSATGAVCFLGLGVAFWLGAGPSGLALPVAILSAALPLLLLREFCRNHALTHLRMVVAITLDGIAASMQLGALLVLWHLGLFSVAAAYAVMGAAAAMACLEWFALQRGRWHVRLSQVGGDWRHNWSFARWALASYLVGSTSPFIIPWILTASAGAAAAGLFGAAGTLVGVANVFVMGLGNFVVAKASIAFAQGGRSGLCRVLRKASLLFVVVVGCFFLVSLVAGESLMVFVYGHQYDGGGLVLATCVLSLLAMSMGIVSGNGLWVLERPRATFAADLCALAATLVTALFLIGPLGALGAALATLAGSVTGGAMKSAKFLQLIRSSPPTPAKPEPSHP